MPFLFASSNAHKIEEIKKLLPDQIELLSLRDAGITEEIPETGSNLEENALLKARYVHDKLKLQGKDVSVFSDDSGLEVKALNGAPGVYSARYAGLPKNDLNNNLKLLEALKLETKREARFVTVIALIIGQNEHVFRGEVAGTIAYAPRGESGFGYDPLFIPRGYRSTFAELGAEVKNKISHRAKAVKGFVDFIRSGSN